MAFNDNRGIGIVSTLVSVVVMSTLFMAALRIISSLQLQQNLLSNSGDQQVLKQQILNLLGNPEECPQSFRDANDQIAKFNPDLAPNDPNYEKQNTLNQIKLHAVELAKPGNGSGRFKISKVALKSQGQATPILVNNVSAKRYLASLVVSVEKRSAMNSDWVESSFSLPFYVSTDNGNSLTQSNIIGCAPQQNANGLQYVKVVRYAAQENSFDSPSTETVSTSPTGVRVPPNLTNTYSSLLLPMRKFLVLPWVDTVTGTIINYEDLDSTDYRFDKVDGFDASKSNMPVLPVNSVAPLLPISPFDVSGTLLTRQYDGMQCNLTQGYHLVDCSLGEAGVGFTTPPKIYPYANGCVTPHLRKASSSNSVYLTINCVKG